MMNPDSYGQPLAPRPIENGQVDQIVVEYRGNRLGAVTYRGPSGREYGFDASPWDKRHYVLAEDLERFRRRPDFRVLEETRIDPQEQRLRALIAEAVERQKAEIAVGPGMASEPDRQPEATRRASKRGGRRLGRGFGAWLDCLMYCGGVKGRYGSAKEAYDTIDGYLREHIPPDQYIPPRERFASMRSDAKVKREKTGRCIWHNHPEAPPGELIPA